jgi:type VI protein secretion system component Hcp
MALVMKADSVVGDSNITEHVGWIDVGSAQVGSHTPVTIKGGGMSADVPSLSDYVVTTVTGKHSPDFWKKHLAGKHFDKVEIEDLILSGDKAPVKSQKTTMTEVYITSFSNSGNSGSGDRGFESITFQYGTIEFEWFTQDDKGAVKSVGAQKYDNKAKKVMT